MFLDSVKTSCLLLSVLCQSDNCFFSMIVCSITAGCRFPISKEDSITYLPRVAIIK